MRNEFTGCELVDTLTTEDKPVASVPRHASGDPNPVHSWSYVTGIEVTGVALCAACSAG